MTSHFLGRVVFLSGYPLVWSSLPPLVSPTGCFPVFIRAEKMVCFDTLRAGAPGFSLFKSWGEGGLVIQKGTSQMYTESTTVT